MSFKRILLAASIILISVSDVSAIDVAGNAKTFAGLVDAVTESIGNSLIALFSTLAAAAFAYGIMQFIWASREGKPDEIQKGQKFMLWSIIALFVMLSAWGIIAYGQKILGFESGTSSLNKLMKGSSIVPLPSSPAVQSPSAFPKYCPNGTPYYSDSDRRLACGSN